MRNSEHVFQGCPMAPKRSSCRCTAGSALSVGIVRNVEVRIEVGLHLPLHLPKEGSIKIMPGFSSNLACACGEQRPQPE